MSSEKSAHLIVSMPPTLGRVTRLIVLIAYVWGRDESDVLGSFAISDLG